MPQLQSDHRFSWGRLYSGLALILVGYLKKVVVADSLAIIVDLIFAHPESYTSLNLLIGTVLYAFQIYCDFSGYSDIAIGIARTLGFDFPRNFNLPYFSRSFSEFWRRWHISLSSWLRDYLYISLGGNRLGKARTLRNLTITMLLGGLWHGAGWNFIVWGGLHAVYLAGERLFSRPIEMLMNFARVPGILRETWKIIIVFSLTCFGWIFFRSESISDAMLYLQGIMALDNFALSQLQHKFDLVKGIFLIGGLIVGEALSLRMNLVDLVVYRPIWRLLIFTGLLSVIALFGNFEANQFIYFQF